MRISGVAPKPLRRSGASSKYPPQKAKLDTSKTLRHSSAFGALSPSEEALAQQAEIADLKEQAARLKSVVSSVKAVSDRVEDKRAQLRDLEADIEAGQLEAQRGPSANRGPSASRGPSRAFELRGAGGPGQRKPS
jgi:hypothetical protein